MNGSQIIKKITQIMSLIFMILVLVYLISGKSLNNRMLTEFLLCSLGAAIIKYVFFPEILFQLSPIKQWIYMLSVWLMVIACSFLMRWEMTIRDILLTGIEVIAIYLCIRFINYQKDKTEARKMNEILEKKRKTKKVK